MPQIRIKECLLIMVAAVCFQCLPAQATKRPNILYLYADDMGWGSIGPNGQGDRRAKGLIIAIPALFIHSFLEARAVGILADIETQMTDFLHLVRRPDDDEDGED